MNKYIKYGLAAGGVLLTMGLVASTLRKTGKVEYEVGADYTPPPKNNVGDEPAKTES